MSSRTKYWIERLASIGLGAFVIGMALVLGGTLWEVLRVEESFGGNAPVTVWTDLLRAIVSLGEPLMFNGVVLYIAGRMMQAWKVSIIGLERGPIANLVSKGPDVSNTVWIGRRYDATEQAEHGAQLLRDRVLGARK